MFKVRACVFLGGWFGKAAVLSAFGFQMVNAALTPLPFPPPLLLSPPLEYQIDRGSANSVRRDQPCVTGALPRAANFPVHRQPLRSAQPARERARESERERDRATEQSVRKREIIRPHDACLTTLCAVTAKRV